MKQWTADGPLELAHLLAERGLGVSERGRGAADAARLHDGDDWPWLCVAVVGTGFLAAPTLSAVADAVSRLAPASVRGEATGLQSSAQSAGFALGSPIVGVAIDVSVPAGGFAAAGLAGLAAALTGCLLSRRCPSPRPPTSARRESARRTDATHVQ
ncbi:MFS transporter [Streptomyces scopuliridis]|uniref:MFS transporter n=1 Tax=Streptomyces scopuliridis TaxID=452529 RepID=UPI003678B1C5